MPISQLENLHPSLWRASQLARGVGEYLHCGHASLAAELPGGGWPMGHLTEILIQQAGSAELQLLAPALHQLSDNSHANKPSGLPHGRIVLLQTPYQPQVLALDGLGIDLARLLWLRCKSSQDALWAAEQILKNGSCSALLFWQNHIKTESLRRLHLAAQTGRGLFCLIRAWESQLSASPAPLRLKIGRTQSGLQIEVIKRRGAQQAVPILLPHSALSPQFSLPTFVPETLPTTSPTDHEQFSSTNRARRTNAFMDSTAFATAHVGSI